jgi:transposase
MGANDKFRSPPWAGRRALAAEMLASGASITRVAAELALSPSTARRYQALFGAGGKDALLRLGDVGGWRRLAPEDIGWIVRAIKGLPVVHGFTGEYWTNQTIGDLIERKFGVRYSRSHINRLIRDHRLQFRFR